MPLENRCKCCNWLFSLWVECMIVTLTLTHVLLTTTELLIYLNIIQVPDLKTDVTTQSLYASTSVTAGNVSSQSTPFTYDNGDTECSYHNVHADLQLALTVIDYVTLVISSLFMMEVISKGMLLRSHFFKDPWQIFDSVVVLCSVGVHIAFFIKHNALLCFHLATKAAAYVIFLRLWRIPRACNVRKKEYERKHENDTKYLRMLKLDLEKKYKDLDALCKSQNEQMHILVKEINEQRIKEVNSKEKEHVLNGKIETVFDNKLAREDYNEALANIEYNEATYEIKNNIQKEQNHQRDMNGDVSYVTLQRNNSDTNSKTYDSGIEVKDSFRSDIDVKNNFHRDKEVVDEALDSNDSNNVIKRDMHVTAKSEQKQLLFRSISLHEERADCNLLRRAKGSRTVKCFENEAYEGEDALDRMRTYRSADGIPMTEL